MKTATKAKLKVIESLYKKYGVTLHFPTGQNLVKKILWKYKYWHYQSKKDFWYIRWSPEMEYTDWNWYLTYALD